MDSAIERLAQDRIGRVLRDKYRLDRLIGVGGMAAVYAATHRNKKRVAIKMLHPHVSLHEEIRTRFLREGYVANSVEHPGAVAVLDDDVAEDGSAYLVMELLDGTSLDDLASRREGNRLPLELLLSVGDALLAVLSAAHAKNIVHRDVKPANLFLTQDGRLQVLDFGIARLRDATSGDQRTETGALLGTPAYMAPEQALARQRDIDAQTDLWAVGATLFTLATGRLVHEAESAAQLLVNAATTKAPPLASVAPAFPAPVAAVIDRALAFDKKDRWASAREMRGALGRACAQATGRPIPALPKKDVTGLEDTTAGPAIGIDGPPAVTSPAPDMALLATVPTPEMALLATAPAPAVPAVAGAPVSSFTAPANDAQVHARARSRVPVALVIFAAVAVVGSAVAVAWEMYPFGPERMDPAPDPTVRVPEIAPLPRSSTPEPPVPTVPPSASLLAPASRTPSARPARSSGLASPTRPTVSATPSASATPPGGYDPFAH